MKAPLLVILVMIYLQNCIQGFSCPTGHILTGTGSCVAENALIQQPCYSCSTRCPTGYVSRNHGCYQKTCPDGSSVVNGRCVSIIKAQCPKDFFFNKWNVC